MGTVYLGHSRGQSSAIKIVHPHLATDEGFRARFIREADISCRVSGPFFATTVDSDLNADPPWIATEFVEGPTLQEWVQRNGPLPADRLGPMGLVLINALDVLHSQGIIHRDLKPANVILSPRGPVLIDFGIAAALDLASLTSMGSILGSTGWMSPEQVVGGAVTSATDVFGWGAVLAFAGTASAPFGYGRQDSLAYRVVEQPPAVEAMPALADLARAAMAKDPTLRPTAAEMLVLIEARVDDAPTIIATQTMALPPDSTLTSLPTPAARPNAKVIRGGAVIVGAVLGVLVWTALVLLGLLDDGPPSERAQAAPPTPTSSTRSVEAQPDQPQIDVAVSDCGLGAPVVRPDFITLTCADGNEGLVDITWDRWEASQAHGTGDLRRNLCDPSCADGQLARFPVTIDLYAPYSQSPPQFTRASVTYLEGSAHVDGRTSDVWTLATTPDSAAGAPNAEATAEADRRRDRRRLLRLINAVPINRELSVFDDAEDDYFRKARIEKNALIPGDVCGTGLRPIGTLHRSAAGGHDYRNFRELFIFDDADAAVAFLTDLEGAVRQCSYDVITGSSYQVLAPITGYAELTIEERVPFVPESSSQILAIRHYLRVGSAVFAQDNETLDLPYNRKPLVDEVARVATEMASYLCGFTEAGC